MERGTEPVKGDFERRAPHLGLQVLPWGREEGNPQAWLWQWVGRTHPNPVRTLDFRRSSRFPPKPALPHTVAT